MTVDNMDQKHEQENNSHQRNYSSTIAQIIQSIGDLSNTSNPIMIVIILLFGLIGGLIYLEYKMAQALEGVTQSIQTLSSSVKDIPIQLQTDREHISLILTDIVNKSHHK